MIHTMGRIAATCLALVTTVALLACDGQAVKRSSELSNTHYLLAQDYIRKKNPEGAKQELNKSLTLNPENQEAHQLLGEVFFLEGVYAMNFLEREQCLTGAAASEQRQEANSKFRQAEKHLLESVKLLEKDNKVDSEGLNYLANISVHFGRYDQAIEYITKALNNVLFVNRYMALGTRGWAYFKKGARTRGARDLRQALFHQPRFCVGRYRLAKIYYDEKQYEKATDELKRVIKDKACRLQEPFQLLGLVFSKTRKPHKARAQFERCVARNPKSCISLECQRYAKLIGQ